MQPRKSGQPHKGWKAAAKARLGDADIAASLVESIAAAIRADGSPRCYDDRCCCSGDEKWDCLLGTTPQGIANIVFAAMKHSVTE